MTMKRFSVFSAERLGFLFAERFGFLSILQSSVVKVFLFNLLLFSFLYSQEAEPITESSEPAFTESSEPAFTESSEPAFTESSEPVFIENSESGFTESLESEFTESSEPEFIDFQETFGHILLPVDTRATIPAEFFSDLFLSYRLSSLLDNAFPQSIYQLESTGAYSFVDGEIYSLYGNSWIWNKTFFNGIETTSAFFPGRSLYLFLPVAHDVHIDGLTGVLDYIPANTSEPVSYAALTLGQQDGHIPYYAGDAYLNSALSDVHLAAQIRSTPPPDERPNSPFAVDVFERIVFSEENNFVLDLFFHASEREILQFDYDGFDGTYSEDSTVLTLMGGKYFPEGNSLIDERPLGWEVGFLAGFLSRNHYGSEFRFREEETLDRRSFSVTPYMRRVREHSIHTQALTLAVHDLDGSQQLDNYNLLRITGEGYNALDTVPATAIELNVQSLYEKDHRYVSRGFLKTALNNRLELLINRPYETELTQDVYFQDREGSSSLYQSVHTQNNTAMLIGNGDFTLFMNDLEDVWWTINVGLDLHYMVVANNNNVISRVVPEFAIDLTALDNHRSKFQFFFGRENTPFSAEYARFLSDDYRTTENYIWEDDNGNNLAESGEVTSEIHSTSGGEYQDIDSEFNQPHYYYLDIPYVWHISQKWDFGLGGHFRTFRQSPWVCAVGSPEDYGEFREVDGTNVFYSTNAVRQYEICNLPEEIFPEDGRNWFNNSPMYLGLTLGVNQASKRVFFSFMFTAYLINGVTRQGHGFVHNSLGVFELEQADPNNLIRPVGRYDADRSYLGRIINAYAITEKLTGMFILTYRDGQPIGAWNYFIDEDGEGHHVAAVREEVSGDNLLLYGGEFGTREDARWNLDLRWKWQTTLRSGNRFEVYLNFYNLLDLALESLEYSTYQEGADRIALETEVPRSVELAFRVLY